MSYDAARALYREPLWEHFGFGAIKGSHYSHVKIVDIEVTVENYISCLPIEAFEPGGADSHRSMIVVELKVLKQALPWKFNAKWWLPDPEKQTVTRWALAEPTLSDALEYFYLVKVAALDPGIYSYTATVTALGDDGRKVCYPLVTKRRTVFFHGDEAKTDAAVAEFRKGLPKDFDEGAAEDPPAGPAELFEPAAPEAGEWEPGAPAPPAAPEPSPPGPDSPPAPGAPPSPDASPALSAIEQAEEKSRTGRYRRSARDGPTRRVKTASV